jgi:hypothetical protein
MLLRFPALYRFLGLAGVAAFAPAIVLACSADVTPIGDGTPNPTATSTDPDTPAPKPTATTTGTTPPPSPPKDGGVDAAKDSGPPPTDVVGSAECTAYCAKMKTKCNKTCDPKFDCAIEKGQCAASTQDFLDCKTKTGTWYCGADGFSIVSSCTRDTSLCN